MSYWCYFCPFSHIYGVFSAYIATLVTIGSFAASDFIWYWYAICDLYNKLIIRLKIFSNYRKPIGTSSTPPTIIEANGFPSGEGFHDNCFLSLLRMEVGGRGEGTTSTLFLQSSSGGQDERCFLFIEHNWLQEYRGCIYSRKNMMYGTLSYHFGVWCSLFRVA